MTRNTEQQPGIRSVETCFDIVETLRDQSQAGLEEIAAATGIANSTAYEHLTTLEEAGYVVHDSDGYRLSLKFLNHGVEARNFFSDIVDVAEPVIEQLVEETKETVNLVVEERGRAVYVSRWTGERGIPTNSWMGKAKPLHTISAGKAILAGLPSETVDRIIDTHGFTGGNENSISSQEELEAELASVREQGYATNDRESDRRIRAVGAPITSGKRVEGAVSVAGPADRLKGQYFETELPDLLLGTCSEIELKLTYQA